MGFVKHTIPMTSSKLLTKFLVKNRDKVQAKKYYERRSHHYEQHISKGILSHLRKRERDAVLRYARFSTNDHRTLIDVGCGGGFFALEAKKHGLTVSAVDISEQMIEAIYGKVDEAWVDDIETIQLQKTFDTVICSGVLDFVVDPEQAFLSLAKLVSPQGQLILQAPRISRWSFIYHFEKWLFGLNVNFYSIHWLFKQAQIHGLRLVDYCYPLPHNLVILFERPGSGPIRVDK